MGTAVRLAWLALAVSALAGAQRAEIRAGDALNCNRLIHHVRPVYPKEAKRKHIEGIVSLRATITKAGRLRDLKVVDGDPLLAPAALNAARKWRYSPCVVDSVAVETAVTIDIQFTFNQ